MGMCHLENVTFDNNYRSMISPVSELFNYQEDYIADNEINNFTDKQNVEEIFHKLKVCTKPHRNFFSIIRYSLLNLLNWSLK